ncbi:MAG: glycosyltransferase family 2 protein, partial [Candidatus Saccharibacteria bacterium]|nr:glycosyltransferase family 2 protein [Microbacteriaceae bacterium]
MRSGPEVPLTRGIPVGRGLAPREVNGPTVDEPDLGKDLRQRRGACNGAGGEQVVGVEIEVIIVDDTSTDNSLAVARGLAAADSRVRVIANASNLGMVGTFNNGLAAATGGFVIPLGA